MKIIQERKNRHNKTLKQFQRERRKQLYRRRLTINDANKMNLNGKVLVNGDKNKNLDLTFEYEQSTVLKRS